MSLSVTSGLSFEGSWCAHFGLMLGVVIVSPEYMVVLVSGVSQLRILRSDQIKIIKHHIIHIESPKWGIRV
jgi:predicted metallopeptidase